MKPNEVRRALLAHEGISIKSYRRDGSFVVCDSVTGIRIACCEKVAKTWCLKFYPFIDFDVAVPVAVRKAEYASMPLHENVIDVLNKFELLVIDGVATCFDLAELTTANTITAYADAVKIAQTNQYMNYLDKVESQYPVEERDGFRSVLLTFMQCENTFKANLEQGYILQYRNYMYKLVNESTDDEELYEVYGGGLKPIATISHKFGNVVCTFIPNAEVEILNKKFGNSSTVTFDTRESKIYAFYECLKAIDNKILELEPKVYA